MAWFAGEPGSGGGKETDKEDEKEQGKNSMDMCFLDPPMNLRLNFGYTSRRNFQKTGYPAYTGGSVPAYRGTAYIYDSSAYTAYSVL